MSYLDNLKANTDFIYTENGAIAHSSTGSRLYDLFALGGAYRTRSDEDCIVLFKSAYDEDPVYALKCLFYLVDCRGGQGERRFWRVCAKWLAKYDLEAMRRNLKYVPEFSRWDNIFVFMGTDLEKDVIRLVKTQLAADMASYKLGPNEGISLLGKWLPSINTSSADTRELAHKIRKALGMSNQQYRKTLSALRERINVLERLMSANRWNEIDFSKIPSKAGFRYRNAFARHDLERAANGEQTYAYFMADKNTTVNAKVLYLYECVAQAFKAYYYDFSPGTTERNVINKYWDNMADFINGAIFNGFAVVDVSGSMYGGTASAPINVAISLGLYCAEKAKGPFANHFMTFSHRPQMIEVRGVDFCDKVWRMLNADWGMDTNIEAVFDILLDIAIKNSCSQDEIPENLIIISDMEFNDAINRYYNRDQMETLFETLRKRWDAAGYKMPRLVFWNVDATQDNIPMHDDKNVTYVSGMSPSIYEAIMTGKTSTDLMYEKLNSNRYKVIC